MPLALDLRWVVYGLAVLGACALLGVLRRSLRRTLARTGPRVVSSLLIVAHNKERVIDGLVRGLAAIGDGSGGSGHEVVIVEDRSDDQTPAIVDRLVRLYGNVRAVHTSDLGAKGGSAVEVGMFMCSSPIVLYLNLETQVHPRMLVQAAAHLLSHGPNVAADHSPNRTVRQLAGPTSFQRKERADRSSN